MENPRRRPPNLIGPAPIWLPVFTDRPLWVVSPSSRRNLRPGLKIGKVDGRRFAGGTFWGDSRELFQFFGMGVSLQGSVRTVPSEAVELALTTDGVQGVDPQTLEADSNGETRGL
jgi:hypothetical protein